MRWSWLRCDTQELTPSTTAQGGARRAGGWCYAIALVHTAVGAPGGSTPAPLCGDGRAVSSPLYALHAEPF